jgi:hypothetical protein
VAHPIRHRTAGPPGGPDGGASPSAGGRRADGVAEGCTGEGAQRPWAAFATHNSSTSCPISHSPRPQGLVSGALPDAGRLGRGSSPGSSRRATDGHLDRLDAAGPYRLALVAASPTARTKSSTTSPGTAAGSCCKLLLDGVPQPGKAARRGGNRDVQLLPATGVVAVMPWRVLQARGVQLRHRAEGRAAWHQPSRSPRQRPPAVTVMARSLPGGAALHRPLGPPQPVQLGRQRSGAVLQVLQVAAAVERPTVDAARPAAPIAGLRGARIGVVRPWPAAASAALLNPEPGGMLISPSRRVRRLTSRHRPWPGCQAPTNPPSRRARPSRSRMAHAHRTPRTGGPAGPGLGAAG